jgi:Pyruvate/2-oxoacid:ferredoxin oxidoreductase gamma subunit
MTGIVSRESVENAIRSTMKAKIVDLNLNAFDAGMKLAAESSAQ